MLYDLHLHSFYSDGEERPKRIFDRALASKVRGIAITDHNGIHQKTKQIVAKVKRCNIDAFEGIEISSQMSYGNNDISLHILGYSLDFNAKNLNKNLKKTILGYEMRAKQIIKKCNKLGIPINYNKLRKQSNEFYISRNTIAKEILKYRKITLKEALKIAFVDEKENWFLSPFQVISLIKESGGMPVLAHPGRLLPQLLKQSPKSILEQLIDCGLRGIEVFYPKHTKSEINELLRLANKYNLIITGGTDYHGPNISPLTKIGVRGITAKDFQQFKNALQETSNLRPTTPSYLRHFTYPTLKRQTV